jgi:hypothetical protein
MARRSTEFPGLSRNEARAEFLSPRPAKSLRETVRAFEHLFGSGCGLSGGPFEGRISRPSVDSPRSAHSQLGIFLREVARNDVGFELLQRGAGPLGCGGFRGGCCAWAAISASLVLRSVRFARPKVEDPLGFVRGRSPIFLPRLCGSVGGSGQSQRRRQRRTSRSVRGLPAARSRALGAYEPSPSRAEEAQRGTVRATQRLQRTPELYSRASEAFERCGFEQLWRPWARRR